MAQGDTPVYQLQDPDGTVLAEFRHDSNGNLIVEQLDGSNIDFKQADASNLNSVSTEQAQIGMPLTGPASNIQWDRPYIGGGETVQVPQEEATIQDALRKVPQYLEDDYHIQIDKSQDPYDEDIIVPPTKSSVLSTPGDGGNVARLVIEDQGSISAGDPDIKLNSVVAFNSSALVVFLHLGPTGLAPIPDENASWGFFAGSEYILINCSVQGSQRDTTLSPAATAILNYGARTKIENDFDFGSDLVERGIWQKRGQALEIGPSNTISGSVTEHAVRVATGEVHHGGRLPDADKTAVNNIDNNSTVGNGLYLTANDGTTSKAMRMDSSGNTRFQDKNGDNFMRAVTALSQVYFTSGYEPRTTGSGDGMVVTTPDGTDEYRIRVDNSGNVVTDGPL